MEQGTNLALAFAFAFVLLGCFNHIRCSKFDLCPLHRGCYRLRGLVDRRPSCMDTFYFLRLISSYEYQGIVSMSALSDFPLVTRNCPHTVPSPKTSKQKIAEE
jgi:hypothetical protein